MIIDTKLEKFYEYVDNVLQQKRVIANIDKWDHECSVVM